MLETQLAPREPEHGLQRLTPIRTFSNRDTQTGLNLQFQHKPGKWEGGKRGVATATCVKTDGPSKVRPLKVCATQVSNYTDLTPPLPFYAVRAV